MPRHEIETSQSRVVGTPIRVSTRCRQELRYFSLLQQTICSGTVTRENDRRNNTDINNNNNNNNSADNRRTIDTDNGNYSNKRCINRNNE